jgi:hypothetical protein
MSKLRTCVTLAALIVAGCATPPSPAPPPPVPEPPAPIVPAPVCPTCDEQTREIARLRQDLATRDAELRDLRAAQREQVKTVQESTREVTRAKAKARRLATQAEAASYIAEVEVAQKALRASLPATSQSTLPDLAQRILESTAEPFAHGDYGAAMERAAQAEQLIAVAMDNQSSHGSRPRAPSEVPLQVAIPLRVAATSNLRRDPQVKSPVIAVLKQDSLLTAFSYKAAWMRVETDDGRMGWIRETQLAIR